MKNFFYTIGFLLFFSPLSIAQDARSVSLKLYSNLDLWQNAFEVQYSGSTLKQTSNNLLYLSPAIAWGKKNFQELEISQFSISKNTYELFMQRNRQGMVVDEIYDGEVTTNINLALRYEYNSLLTGIENSKIKTYLGLSVKPYFQKIDLKPSITTLFPKHFTSFGLDFGIVPRFNYHKHERLIIDVSVPVNLARLGYKSILEKNIAIPVSLQTTKIDDIRFLHGESLIRLGAAFVL